MPHRVLVTGATGFAGSHLLELLSENGDEIVAWYRPRGTQPPVASHSGLAAANNIQWVCVDPLDRRGVVSAIGDARPDAIYHCAGHAHVGSAWDSTHAAFEINVLATHYLLDAVRELRCRSRILVPGSAMVYRQSAEAIDEDHPIGPASPYGLSKLAQEMLGARAVAGDQAEVLLPRSFNHIGPRQQPSYVASSFARQIARIEAGELEPVLYAGNVEARRDWTDVRDTVRAYRLLVDRGVPGRIYNICSGRTYAARDVLDGLLTHATVQVTVQVNPSRLRPNDVPIVLGNASRIRGELGWSPQIPIERTLQDLLDYWRGVVHRDSVRG